LSYSGISNAQVAMDLGFPFPVPYIGKERCQAKKSRKIAGERGKEGSKGTKYDVSAFFC